MKDLTIPIPNDGNVDTVEIEVKVGKKKIVYNFRVESFPWEIDEEPQAGSDNITNSLIKVERLKEIIRTYDNGWELIQIFTPKAAAKHIQLLFREKRKLKS